MENVTFSAICFYETTSEAWVTAIMIKYVETSVLALLLWRISHQILMSLGYTKLQIEMHWRTLAASLCLHRTSASPRRTSFRAYVIAL